MHLKYSRYRHVPWFTCQIKLARQFNRPPVRSQTKMNRRRPVEVTKSPSEANTILNKSHIREHWYHVLFLLHCYYMTRRICGIKQVTIVAFFCWLPIMFTLFPSLAIASFLHFSYWGITFTQCATICPEINCYYKHQSSSLLLLLLFLYLTSQHLACYKQLLVYNVVYKDLFCIFWERF